MKIGIIGCGYVGRAMALQWKQQGHQVSVTTRRPERVSYLKAFADQVYLLQPPSLKPFIDQQDILLITVAPDQGSDYSSTYLNTAKQVSEAVDDSSIQQILYTSSTSVYGDQNGAWVDEDTSITCMHENGKILFEAEQVLLQCPSQNITVCILRLGEIYGPGREIEQRLRRMQQHPFAGTGASYTNLIHLTDIQNALDFALKHRLPGIYNLCSDFHMFRSEFYAHICQKENLPPIQWDPKRVNLHAGNRRVSNQKIKNAGFTFSYPDYF